MQLVDGYGPFDVDKSFLVFGLPPTNHPLFKSVASLPYNSIPASLKSVKKGIIWIDFLQFLYQNSYAGNLSREVYDTFRKESQVTTPPSDLSEQPIACFVLIVVAVDSAGKEVVIIDTDNDKDFSNNMPTGISQYTSDEDFIQRANKGVPVQYETIADGKRQRKTIPLNILQQNDRYFYSFPQYAVGKIVVENKTHPVAVSHQSRFANYCVADLLIDPKEEHVEKPIVARKGQYVSIGNRLFRNDGVRFSNMTLTLTEVSKTVEGSQTGMTAIKFSGEDVLTGKTISLENFRGKYVFIDFWGTWCGPCLGQLPELTKLYASVDTAKIIFIGIAGRDKPENVLKLVKARNIPWHNIVSNDTNSIIERYNIVAFPTGILVSPEGKIVETNVKSLRETLTRYRLQP